MPEQEGGELLQKLALLQDAVAKEQVFGSNWRQVLQQRQQQLQMQDWMLQQQSLQTAEQQPQQQQQHVEQGVHSTTLLTTLDLSADQQQHEGNSMTRVRVLSAVRDAFV
jgi:hypothetical protein